MKRFAFVLVLAGCTVGPEYKKPEIKAPEKWSTPGLESGPGDLSPWWTLFKDPVLNSLVDRAVESNLDLRLAQSRIRESRAQAVAAGAQLVPGVGAEATANRSRTSGNGSAGAFNPDLEHNLFRAGFDAVWELDLFGGIRRGIEAAEADAEVAVESRRGVLVSLLGEVAGSYVAYRGYQRQMASLEENLAAAKDTLALTTTRRDAGLGTDLDVARVEALVAASESQVPTVEAGKLRAAHRLAVLIGREPGALLKELEPVAAIPSAPEKLVMGLPSELLLRRPDVRQAERQLAAVTARIGVATAAIYPNFSLGAILGLESVNLADFAKGASTFWSIGPSLTVPVFQGSRLRANVEIYDARQEQAMVTYERAFLLALEEVENALVNFIQEEKRRRVLVGQVASNERAKTLAEDLNGKGLTTFLDVLDAKRTLYATNLQLAQSESAVAANLVALYKALGGGWETQKP